MPDHEKLVIMVTHGPEDPELATIPFVMAGAAVASDVEVVMGFQGDGCRLVQKGVADSVTAPEFAPLSGLLDSVREFGGRLHRGRARRGRGDLRRGALRRRGDVRHQHPRLLGGDP